MLKKIQTEIYNQTIQYQTEYRESSNYYKDTKVVQTKGVNGLAEINALVTYVGGEEVAREITAETVVSAPVNEVILIGTASKPTTNPTGYFINPCPAGVVGDTYGYRVYNNKTEFHKGLDIIAPYGVAVLAADGGTVIIAGKSSSYGNYVRIRHANGVETLYAHMSSLLVSTGEKVYQGQQIGKVGSTGDSTGNHLHWEVYSGGVTVNPRPLINRQY